MRNLNWNNRFLVATIALIVVFAIVVGWIIIRENTNTTEAAVANNTITTPPAQPRPVNTYQNNSPSRAPETSKQMYAHIQSAENAAQNAVTVTDTNTQAYNQGFDWATQHKILNKDDCNQLGAEYRQGCQSYLEVKNYVSQTDPNRNTPVN